MTDAFQSPTPYDSSEVDASTSAIDPDPFRLPAPNPQAHRFERGKLLLGLAESGTEICALAAMIVFGAGGWLAGWAGQINFPPIIAAPALTIIIAFGLDILTLPLAYWRGFEWERRFSQSRQTRREWMKDHAKGMALGLALLAMAAAIIYGIMAVSPQFWWLFSGIVLFCGFIILAKLTPTILLPIFFKFEPLDNPGLRQRLDAMAARAGMQVEGIYLWRLGEKSRAANAAFTGTGRTRRVILSDTLLENFTPDEIEAVFAHELGHWKLGHITRSLAMQGAALMALLAAAHVALRLAAPASSVSDLALLPSLGLALFAGGMILSPLAMAMSRRFEFQADAFAIQAMGRPAPLLDALRKLAGQNLADANPPRWVEVMFHSHPSITRRIEAAKQNLAN